MNRFQFNLAALFFVTLGLLAGSILTLKGISSIFATSGNSTTITSNASFTQGTLTATAVSGSENDGKIDLVVPEQFTNTDFETNLSSWTGNYNTNTFTTSGTFTSNASNNVEVLVVAGGGGGGHGYGGGGGAGGLIYNAAFAVTAQAYSVTVGNGGADQTSGQNSVFSTLTAVGGGKGGTATAGSDGGSGGGGGHSEGLGGSPTAGQGYAGGKGHNSSSASAGGGGGAGGVGEEGVVNHNGAAGGIGLSYDISGTPTYYAGGGGGGVEGSAYTGGIGGNGGGGNGGRNNSPTIAGTAGTPNTGGGGGGGGTIGGAGGSGIVIIRYPAYTRETTITYGSSAGSAKLVNGSSDAQNFTQTVNVGDTSTYNLSAYAYTTGSAVTSSDVELFYNGSTVSPTYTSVGGGWYQLTGTVTGANASRVYGVQVKSGKTVYIDNVSLKLRSFSGTYTSPSNSNAMNLNWNGGWGDGTAGSTAFSADVTTPTNTSISFDLKTATSLAGLASASWVNIGTASATGTFTATAATLASVPTGLSRYAQVRATLATTDGASTPSLNSYTLSWLKDNTNPTANPTVTTTSATTNVWTLVGTPNFTFASAADGDSGIEGYCLYFGTDDTADPASSKGLLGTTEQASDNSSCPYVTYNSNVNLTTALASALTDGTYYLNVRAKDYEGNKYTGATYKTFTYKYDATRPTNVGFLTMSTQNFSNVADMYFSWPTTGTGVATDSASEVLGWQYQINSTSGSWQGTTANSTLGLDYIPATASAYFLIPARDTNAINSGNNVIYFRTVDNAGNFSTDATIRTGNITFGGAAPAFGGGDSVTVTPSTSTSNSYALSWPAATPATGKTVTHYYYMINTSPPSTLATLQGNASTYIDTTTTRTVTATALANVNKGTNTVYVVAIDNASTPNYSPSNYISGTFTLNSTDPDNVGSLVSSDSSIKASSQWNVTLTWVAPTYQGAGNLTYLVKRSTDNSTFTQVGTTSGLSYVDNTPASALYYYKVYTKDGANAVSSGTNAVSITPTGKWTSAPSLDSGPTAGSLTTKKATITWTTSRSADSKVQYGTTSGSYSSDEVSNSSQTSSHTVNLTNLKAGTTYYYKAKWTDEDGNTGTSDEKTFNTTSAPTAKNVSVTSIGLTSGLINYTVTNASSVKIYYGTTTSFGGTTTVSTSTSETAYTTQLTGLLDGTKYYYKINSFDSDSNEYEGTVLDFTTLPRPKISNVRIQQVANTAQSTILVSWTTNTEVSSIVTYYPSGDPSSARDEVNVALIKGDHKIIIRSLLPNTPYNLIVKGRDKIGNEAQSDIQRVTTATDTRPPQISELHVEGSNVPSVGTTGQEQTAQLVVSWNTDEPGTSQVEFGEGTGTTYSQKSQEDANLTLNHLVIISSLTPAKVYHLRSVSKDKANNIGNSIDTVTITPKATENALNLVIGNLQQAFGFLGGINK